MIGDLPRALNLNRVFTKLNQSICNKQSGLPFRSSTHLTQLKKLQRITVTMVCKTYNFADA